MGVVGLEEGAGTLVCKKAAKGLDSSTDPPGLFEELVSP